MQLGECAVSSWERIGRIGGDALVPVRKELHRAVQFPAAIGRSLAQSEPEYVHTTLEFWGSVGTLVSRESASTGVRLGLAPAEGRLVFFGPGRGIVGDLGLRGRTREQVWGWIEATLEETGTRPDVLDRRHPEYDLPEHRLDEGESFQLSHVPACAELARHFANAHQLLSALTASDEGAAPVLTWPGSFATVWTSGRDPQKRRGRSQSISYGFCAGDDAYRVPYWYVVRQPAPDSEDLPDLEGPGSWHVDDWIGAVLPVNRLAEVDDQPAMIVGFLREGRSAISPNVERLSG